MQWRPQDADFAVERDKKPGCVYTNLGLSNIHGAQVPACIQKPEKGPAGESEPGEAALRLRDVDADPTAIQSRLSTESMRCKAVLVVPNEDTRTPVWFNETFRANRKLSMFPALMTQAESN